MGEVIIARREFLKTGGALLVGFAIIPRVASAAQSLPGPRGVAPDAVDSFLVIGRDGQVTLYSGKVDLGTGCRVAYRQIVADELDVPFARIDMIEGDTALTPDQGTTGGSTGIAGGGVQIRQAAATARLALVAMAVKHLGAPQSDLTVEDGIIRAPGGRQVSYGELIGNGRFELKIDKAAPLKDPARYKYAGQVVQRPDLPAKMTGRHTYVQDFRVPGMLHARVIRPHAVGAGLSEVDEASIANIPGARVIRVRDFLAVVADQEWNAIRAARALRVRWTGGGGLPGSGRVHQLLRSEPVDHDEQLVREGDSPRALHSTVARSFTASYEWPAQSHASIGPSCAVAEVADGKATIWSASQGTHHLRQVIARGLSIPQDNVRVIYLDGAGCYGMNGSDDAAVDAALIAREAGRPVRVQWMREDEHGRDPKGPPQLMDLRAAIDGKGDIIAWESEA
jgi:nicotinate dehydrogenase subunit B